MKKYIAELTGTFILALAVGLSLSEASPVSTAPLAALIVMVLVYLIGPVSGTHLNPAVTIGAWSIKKINGYDTLLYILSQYIGAIIAFFVISLITTAPHLTVLFTWTTLSAEILGTFLLSFSIASVIYEKTLGQLSGIVIGGSLLLGICLAVLIGSNGVLNPAVALSINSVNLIYIVAPIIGSVTGMHFYKYLTR